ncbi:hypothetical protein MHI24_28690 [Paenibacillus sp. FSL K6-1096]|uniref:hypothetical protein n=1 Tax=Paenibacillus sp. FSL K6-1096 TaxID=2921460 RepID=UPI0030ECBCC2
MRKMLHALLLPVILLLLLTSCNTETTHYNYTFKGEGEIWSGVYKQEASRKLITKKEKVKSETSNRYTFDLHYKGKQSDLGEIKQFKYGFKGMGRSSSRMEEGPVRINMLHMEGYGNAAFEYEDSVIKVTVEWDGQKEEFELKNEK